MTFLKKIIPSFILKRALPLYHFLWAYFAAAIYGFPSRKLTVIAVTGTKGKSSTTEILAHILRTAGKKVAQTGTIRFMIDTQEIPNLYKMSMPGRFFMQRFLHQANKAHCTHAVLEMTSEGARQFRHKAIALDALVFTNLSPEHIESHGSFGNYRNAKRSIGLALAASTKRPRTIVANVEDEESAFYLALPVERQIAVSVAEAEPVELHTNSATFQFNGVTITSPLTGRFNVVNALCAAHAAAALGVSTTHIAQALSSMPQIKGRVQRVVCGQDFDVVVDYAHTIDSLKALYEAFPNKRKICVLGNTGGGRDTWKRPGMAKVAEQFCDEIILTDEDPYDEDPQKIVDEMRVAIVNKPCEIILDRRAAIAAALRKASKDSVVLISGKGTDPFIMRAHGSKEPWSDFAVATEELTKIAHQ